MSKRPQERVTIVMERLRAFQKIYVTIVIIGNVKNVGETCFCDKFTHDSRAVEAKGFEISETKVDQLLGKQTSNSSGQYIL